jgi:hypothetical protein
MQMNESKMGFHLLSFGGDREGHTANYVNNAANRAARGRVGYTLARSNVAMNT